VDNILKPVIGAVFLRLIVLPLTLRTDKYFSVMRLMYRTLNKRIRSIAVEFANDPVKIYVEDIFFQHSYESNPEIQRAAPVYHPCCDSSAILFLGAGACALFARENRLADSVSVVHGHFSKRSILSAAIHFPCIADRPAYYFYPAQDEICSRHSGPFIVPGEHKSVCSV
jgi:hypothetical protein